MDGDNDGSPLGAEDEVGLADGCEVGMTFSEKNSVSYPSVLNRMLRSTMIESRVCRESSMAFSSVKSIILAPRMSSPMI